MFRNSVQLTRQLLALQKVRETARLVPVLSASLTSSASLQGGFNVPRHTMTQKPKSRYTRFWTSKDNQPERASTVFLAFLLGTMLSVLLGIPQNLNDRLEKYLKKADCASGQSKIIDNKCSKKETEEGEDDDSEGDEKKKKRIGFRDRRIIGYEDRIRSYSTPDKIFRYFATLKCFYEDGGTDTFMTPEDFVRSITPGVKQPEGLGLDAFKKIDPKTDSLELHIAEDSVFYCLGNQALISFSDYIFLLTVISTPQRQFEIAFRMFDLNGDGELELEEFDVVRSVIRDTTAVGKRHRDRKTTGNMTRGTNSALSTYFFGENGDKKLTIARFLEFQTRIQNEIMKLEFERYNPKDNRIRESDFADVLLIYAGFSEAKKRKMIKRIKQKYAEDENAQGITFEEYTNFSQLLRSISDVDTALTFYHLAGAAIDRATLRHVTRSVANVELSDHLLDVIYTLFDENNDGHLSNREFVSVMKQRLLRGLDHPMDTGFVRLISAMFKCSVEQASFQKVEQSG